jgi:hypothetical protein
MKESPMPGDMEKPFSEKDKVMILLHEYDKLCQEIHNRTSSGFQLLAVGAVVFVWIISQQRLDGHLWSVIVVSAIILSCGTWMVFRDIKKAATRLRELEKDINRRAGEELLVWETRWGGDVTGDVRGHYRTRRTRPKENN